MGIQEIISSGLLELYALGIATNEENIQVEQWIKQYPEVESQVVSIQKAMETYAFMHAVEPSASVKESIFKELGTNNKIDESNGIQQKSKVVQFSPLLQWAAAASIILLIGSTIFNVIFYNKYQDEQIAKQQVESQLLAQTDENRVMQKDMSVVQSKFSEPVALHGLEAAPGAAAKIFWMKNTGEVYVDASNLPDCPPGKQYQLWAIVDGKPVDGGMIKPVKNRSAGKFSIQKMKSFGKAEAFAITLETEGGNPTPKGDMYVMGKI